MDSDENSSRHVVVEKDKEKPQFTRVLILHSKEIVAAVVIGVIITVFSSVILDYIYPEYESKSNVNMYKSPEHMTTVEPNYREYIIRAGLANVYSALLPIKTQISVYFQMMGEFPVKKQDFDISKYDLDEHKYIHSSFMTNEGGIGVNLTKEFGEDKYLVLKPSASKNGAFIKWQCSTNVDEKYLGLSQSRFCDFQASID